MSSIFLTVVVAIIGLGSILLPIAALVMLFLVLRKLQDIDSKVSSLTK